MPIRRQATLYLPSPESDGIESIRLRFNPQQFALIRAHVTLCREDEVRDWGDVTTKLTQLAVFAVTLSFGPPVRDGHLVYLPVVGSRQTFDALRNSLLSTSSSSPREHNPHLTLIHPRNGTCSDAAFDEISSRFTEFTVTFRQVTFIEQIDAGPWRDLQTFG